MSTADLYALAASYGGNVGASAVTTPGCSINVDINKDIRIFRQFLSTARSFYHVFGVVESRFAQEVDDVFSQFNGFSVLRQDRNKHGGGVTLYISNNYKAYFMFVGISICQETGYPGVFNVQGPTGQLASSLRGCGR